MKNIPTTVFRLLTGTLGLILISSLAVGPRQTFLLAFLLVVCTAGIGLIPLLLAAYLVGTVIDLLVNHKRRASEKEAINNLQNASSDMQALVLYIIDARKAGMKDGDIRKTLRENGWGDEFISDAFGMV